MTDLPRAPRRRDAARDVFDQDLFAAVQAQVSGQTPRSPVIVAGGIGAGKTEAGLRLARRLQQERISVGGILAPRLFERGETVGYNVLDLLTGEDAPFARPDPPGQAVGRFYVQPAGLAFAERALHTGAERAAVVLVDEIGRWELGGGGHAAALSGLLAARAVPVLFVRAELVPAVIDRFGLQAARILRLRDASRDPLQGRKSFWDIVDSVPYPLLVTLAPDGFPQSRPMTLAAHDERSLWFATSRGSRKIAQIQAHREVTVLFVDTDRYNYASFHGLATLDDDAERARALWRPEWRDDWPNGASDPDYGLLRVAGVRGFFLHGATGEAGEIDLKGSS